MNKPMVSVCVPMFNGERYLSECLSSIALQTFADFEVVIVDDCSSDDGLALARQWATRDSRFTVHRNEKNLGLVGNWNRAIALARGTWIKFLFQDDYMEPDCLARMLEAGSAGGGFIACDRSLVYTGPVPEETKAWYAEHARMLQSIFRGRPHLSADDFSLQKLEHLDSNIVGEPIVTLIRRDLFEQFGLFDASMVQVCDSDMWNRLGANVGIDYVDRKLVSFRIHGDSTSSLNGERRFRGWVLDKIVEVSNICYSGHFKALRRTASRLGKRKKLLQDRQSRVFEAFDEVKQLERSNSSDRIARQQLKAVLDEFRGYHFERLRFEAYRLTRRLPGFGVAKYKLPAAH